jgi:hypothetical protein
MSSSHENETDDESDAPSLEQNAIDLGDSPLDLKTPVSSPSSSTFESDATADQVRSPGDSNAAFRMSLGTVLMMGLILSFAL